MWNQNEEQVLVLLLLWRYGLSQIFIWVSLVQLNLPRVAFLKFLLVIKGKIIKRIIVVYSVGCIIVSFSQWSLIPHLSAECEETLITLIVSFRILSQKVGIIGHGYPMFIFHHVWSLMMLNNFSDCRCPYQSSWTGLKTEKSEEIILSVITSIEKRYKISVAKDS